MLAEDADAATSFSTEGYLIGQRLNPNRSTFLRNAATLLGKAQTADLPGYKNPESLAAIERAISDHRNATATQQETDEDASADRIARDKLIKKINSRRLAIQHAADGIYPYTNDDFDPARKAFQFPLDRPFSG